MPHKITAENNFIYLTVDLVLLLSLGTLVARQLAQLWANRQSGGIGSRLHLRLTGAFAALALVPTVTVAVVTAARRPADPH